ncbi:DUF397 domain-containing protein [Nocardia sp. SYP-A9097]|uniref:DUF397 domain-containing protein n=1 Tax=Nocardia sp. SYP-A9097 TaxID=2663237 RepID=UPI0013233845|nr:DUF397 domain-containing protein [Nocardia sp. SYP-A9097]MRH91500.1 DUF397 domain-containing protein [Nocardia sp. SYP-A9097]
MKGPAFGVWFKSSRSEGGKACVEIRHDTESTLVRDTKDNGRGPILTFPADDWTTFVASRVWEG